jgi:hypothetical protein
MGFVDNIAVSYRIVVLVIQVQLSVSKFFVILYYIMLCFLLFGSFFLSFIYWQENLMIMRIDHTTKEVTFLLFDCW